MVNTMATFISLPSGNVRAVIRKRGVFRSATFPDKATAREWAAAQERQVASIVASGVAPPPQGATLADLIEKFEELSRPKGRTRRFALKFLHRELGSTLLSKFNAATLRDFVDKRQRSGASGVTIAGDLSTLASVLKWGRIVRLLDVNPQLAIDARAALPHRGLNTRGNSRAREPTPGEMERLYAHWASKGSRQRVPMGQLCRFALASAMRLGEICAITVEDYDPAAHTVVVRDRKDPRRKHGNDQVVPLSPEAEAILASTGRTRGRLFPFSSHSVSTLFTRAAEACGIDDLRFHDLRHAAVSSLFRRGLVIPEVALISGHKTWSMLRRYTVVQPGDVASKLHAKTAKD